MTAERKRQEWAAPALDKDHFLHTKTTSEKKTQFDIHRKRDPVLLFLAGYLDSNIEDPFFQSAGQWQSAPEPAGLRKRQCRDWCFTAAAASGSSPGTGSAVTAAVSGSCGRLSRSVPFAHQLQQRPPAAHRRSCREASLLVQADCALEGTPHSSMCLDWEDMEAAQECSCVLPVLK